MSAPVNTTAAAAAEGDQPCGRTLRPRKHRPLTADEIAYLNDASDDSEVSDIELDSSGSEDEEESDIEDEAAAGDNDTKEGPPAKKRKT